MKRLWFLLLISPLLLGGCLQFPGGDALTQTVQKGPPPPVDPKLAPGPKVAKESSSAPATPSKSSFAAKQHTTLKRPVVTADDVREDTAYAMAEALADEITHDMNTCAAHGATGCPHCEAAPPK